MSESFAVLRIPLNFSSFQTVAQLHQKTRSFHHTVAHRTAHSPSLSQRGSVAVRAAANLVHFRLQNATREGSMRHQMHSVDHVLVEDGIEPAAGGG